MQNGERNPARCDVVKRALTLYDHPFIACRSLHHHSFHAAAHEISCYAVDGHAMPRDHHAALAGSRESGLNATTVRFEIDLESRGLFTDVGVAAARVDNPRIEVQYTRLVERDNGRLFGLPNSDVILASRTRKLRITLQPIVDTIDDMQLILHRRQEMLFPAGG